MPATRVSRHMFSATFAASLAAVALIVTGLIGYQPPPNLNPAALTWRTGAWTGGIIWEQVAVGLVFLVIAVVLVNRINRRLPR